MSPLEKNLDSYRRAVLDLARTNPLGASGDEIAELEERIASAWADEIGPSRLVREFFAEKRRAPQFSRGPRAPELSFAFGTSSTDVRTFPGWRRRVLELAELVGGRDLEDDDVEELAAELAESFGDASPEQFISEHYALAMSAVRKLARGVSLEEQRKSATAIPARLHKTASPARTSSSSRMRKTAPQIPSRATLRQQWVRCGKTNCSACKGGGRGHGPYWYAAWKEHGRTRTKSLGRELPPELLGRRRDHEARPGSRAQVHVHHDQIPPIETWGKPGIAPPPKFRKRPSF